MKKLIGLERAIEAHMPGLSTWQVLPNRQTEYLDPFILLNHHGPDHFPPQNAGLPFGPHPHRGFETLTFVFAGDIVHEDSTGKSHLSRAGDVQWMTAGRGIIHSEVSSAEFKAKGGEEEVLQLWMNLPRKLKMTEPAYRGYRRAELRQIELAPGATAFLIAGEIAGQKGPHPSLTGLTLGYLELAVDTDFELKLPAGETVLFYPVRGELSSAGEALWPYRLARWSTEGDTISARAEKESIVIFGSGPALREPKIAQGPFVMNTVGELKQAFLDYQSGKFA